MDLTITPDFIRDDKMYGFSYHQKSLTLHLVQVDPTITPDFIRDDK
jgi:hypothetical protein